MQFLKRRVVPLTSKVAVTTSGQQPSGVFAMNPDCFIDANGEIIQDCSSDITWTKWEMFSDCEKVALDDNIRAIVKLSLGTQHAVDFFLFLKKCFNHNFLPGLLVVCGGDRLLDLWTTFCTQ